jgi:ribosomal protein S18 acetylase RimI-like enzyme
MLGKSSELAPAARKKNPLRMEETAMIVKFRPMQAEDKELFKSFIRSLPREDNYYLLIDVQNDQAIDRWMEKIQSGQTIGVVATEGSDMIGYCNLKTNDLAWTRHVGEICISVSAKYRGRGIGKALAEQIFLKARARGLQKLWTRMAISQDAAQHMFMSLGFRTEALLSDFVKNENGLTDSLVIMSHDTGEHWTF